MTRSVTGKSANSRLLEEIGLDADCLKRSIESTYSMLDRIDVTLTEGDGFPLSQTVELANLSSMIGNILGGAIARHSKGNFTRNGPHKYPDLLSTNPTLWPNIEIKMALEQNKPKGHLAKPGYYLTCRYVLCAPDGKFVNDKKNRGTVPYIWELRLGRLEEEHFSISNTAGDSGKTAVVNKSGMDQLKVIYVDFDRAPFAAGGVVHRQYGDFFN